MPPSSPKARMSDLQGMLPEPDSGDELAHNSAYHREMVYFDLTLSLLNLKCLEGCRGFLVLCCCTLLTPAPLFLVTSKWVAVGPLLSPESNPAWSGQAAQLMHASNSSDRGLQAQLCLLLLHLALHYINFKAEEVFFLSLVNKSLIETL